MGAAWRLRLNEWFGDRSLKRLARNASFLFGAEGLVTLVSLVQFPLITRWLGPENYGLLGVVLSWVALVGQILSIPTWEVVIKYLSEFMVNHDEPRALAIVKLSFMISLTMGLLTFLVVMLSADWAARVILKTPGGADLIRLEALHDLMMITMGVWMAVLRVFDRFRFISIYNVVSAIAQFVLSVLALSLGLGVAGIILAAALTNFLQTIVLIIVAWRDLRRRFHGWWFLANLKNLDNQWPGIRAVLFSANINTFRKMALINADMVVLSWFTSPAHAGVYRLAKQLASSVDRFINPVSYSLFPEVTKLFAAEGPARVRAMLSRVTRGMVIGLVVLFAGAYSLSNWLVPLVFGPNYIPAIPLFHILLLANIGTVMLWAPSLLISAGRANQLTVINTISSFVMLTLLLILVRLWGNVGAAVALVSFHLTWLALMYPATRKVLAG